MSSLLVDLWESIFVPGPTPALLRAANATFAALQAVLAALLVATYSIHFVVLSALCAALWWSVNWFARELAAAAAADQNRAGKMETPATKSETEPADDGGGGEHGSDNDTEVETEMGSGGRGRRKDPAGDGGAAQAALSPVDVRAAMGLEGGEVRLRVVSSSLSESPGFMSQSSASTEDEWEKVSENEKR